VFAGFASLPVSVLSSVFFTSGDVAGFAGDPFGSTVGLTTGLTAGLAVAVGAGVGLFSGLFGVDSVPLQAPNAADETAKTVANIILLIDISSFE
jgi:hypothetical protein